MQVTETSDDIIDEFSVGRMDYHCSHCNAKFWENEKLSTSTKDDFKFSICCGQGKVVIPALPSPPELLMHLLTATDSRGRAFREYIRAYNSALVFASLGVNLDKELASARRGVYTFRIHGVVHHYIGQLTPEREKLLHLHKFTSMMVLLRESWRIASDTLEMRVSPSCDYCRTCCMK